MGGLQLSVSLLLSLREGATAERSGSDGVAVEGHGLRLLMRPVHPAVAEALLRLAPPGCDADLLADEILSAGGAESLAAWYYTVERLERRGLVNRTVRSGERRLATLMAVSTTPVMFGRPDHVPPRRRYRLSRFAYLRRDGDVMVLESPTAHARVILHDPAASALAASLAVDSTLSELTERASHLPPDAVREVLGLVARAGLVEHWEVGRADGDEPVPTAVDAWEFHDLLFHARTRRGRTDAPFGGTYRLAGRMAAPAPVRPIPDGAALPLFRPDLSQLEERDPPLVRVVEARRSQRIYGERPLDAQQLGEFLYRVARVREQQDVELETPRGPMRVAMVSRPYPSGGGLYELEFYAAVAACDGVEPGLHYYEPRGHALVRIRARTAEVEGLFRDAAESAGISPDAIQVLLIVSARLPRVAWKYASMAYALVLKHVGVVLHSMYLAATAMDLAPCALGAGDSDLFARAAGTDYYAETSVGEFLLGSRRMPAPHPR
jgi:SagB-type dehydrogenase family enzyme